MGEVINIKKQKYEMEYISKDGQVVGVTHSEWPFRIMRKDNEVAIVCEETDEPFGILDRNVFNTILMCWLLVDDPKIIKEAKG